MLDTILNHKLEILTVALAVIGAASVCLNVLAPLTKNKVDDRAAGLLKALVGALEKLSLNVRK